jgi:sarcosine oxidase subunit alpha
MERSGGWWRPWTYGDPDGEYWAVREAVSIMDVSTLGKMIVSGPDALQFLERLYPTKVATIRDGRSRYVLLLNERGYVFDDGLICKESDTRYSLTFTSGGVSHSEMWLRDWAESWEMDVRILHQTMSLGAINVTGPLAKQLLAKAGLENPPGWLGHLKAEVAGAPCQVFRLSFTGELSFELHHPAEHSVHLWRTLLELGQEFGIRPHGLKALERLRLEKGHILVGQDTDFDSTPRRIHHEWAVRLEKSAFIGRYAVMRTNQIPLDKMLVGLEMPDGPAPIEGAVIRHNGEFAGHVTSSAWSPVLNKVVMLGWLYYFDDVLPEEVTIDGRTARRVPVPFYDKEASRARA